MLVHDAKTWVTVVHLQKIRFASRTTVSAAFFWTIAVLTRSIWIYAHTGLHELRLKRSIWVSWSENQTRHVWIRVFRRWSKTSLQVFKVRGIHGFLTLREVSWIMVVLFARRQTRSLHNRPHWLSQLLRWVSWRLVLLIWAHLLNCLYTVVVLLVRLHTLLLFFALFLDFLLNVVFLFNKLLFLTFSQIYVAGDLLGNCSLLVILSHNCSSVSSIIGLFLVLIVGSLVAEWPHRAPADYAGAALTSNIVETPWHGSCRTFICCMLSLFFIWEHKDMWAHCALSCHRIVRTEFVADRAASFVGHFWVVKEVIWVRLLRVVLGWPNRNRLIRVVSIYAPCRRFNLFTITAHTPCEIERMLLVY